MKPQGAVERGRGGCGGLGPAGWPGARPRALQLRVLCICLCGAPPRWGVAGGGWSTFFLTDWHLYNLAPASPRPVPSPVADKFFQNDLQLSPPKCDVQQSTWTQGRGHSALCIPSRAPGWTVGPGPGLFLFSSWLSKPLLLEKLPVVKVFNKHIELS